MFEWQFRSTVNLLQSVKTHFSINMDRNNESENPKPPDEIDDKISKNIDEDGKKCPRCQVWFDSNDYQNHVVQLSFGNRCAELKIDKNNEPGSSKQPDEITEPRSEFIEKAELKQSDVVEKLIIKSVTNGKVEYDVKLKGSEDNTSHWSR